MPNYDSIHTGTQIDSAVASENNDVAASTAAVRNTAPANTNIAYAISAADVALKTFTIAGNDLTATFVNGEVFTVNGSTANDGSYTVSSSALSGADTVITVTETVLSAIADGNITWQAVSSDRVSVIGGATYIWVDGDQSLEVVRYSATTDGVSANRLVDSSETFPLVIVGDIVNNDTDGTSTTVTDISLVASGILILADDIFASGEAYSIGYADTGLYLTSAVTTYGVGEDNEGRWKAQVGGVIDIEMFGSLTATTLQLACDLAEGHGGLGFRLPSGTYGIDTQITLPATQNIKFVGAGKGVTVLQASASITNVLYKGNDTTRPAVQLHDLTIDCNQNADYGVRVERSNGNYWANVEIINWLVGAMYLYSSTGGTNALCSGGKYIGLTLDAGINGLSTGSITSTADNGGGEIRITSTAHGLSTSDYVNAGGFSTDIGGRYQITKIGDDTFDLDGSTWSANETGNWWKRADYGIVIGTNAPDNKFTSCTVEYAGLYGIDCAANHNIFVQCHMFGGGEYDLYARARIVVSGCYFDTAKYAVLVGSDNVTITGSIFYRNSGGNPDPNAMTAVRSDGSAYTGFTFVGNHIAGTCTSDYDANGGSVGGTDTIWLSSSDVTAEDPRQSIPFPQGAEPRNIAVRGDDGTDSRYQFKSAGELRWEIEKNTTVESETGTADGTTASKLIDSGATWDASGKVAIGDIVENTTDDTSTTVSAVDSDTALSLNDDIFVSGEAYKITYANLGSDLDIEAFDNDGNSLGDYFTFFRSGSMSAYKLLRTNARMQLAHELVVTPAGTLSDGDATPDISAATLWQTEASAGTTITDFDSEAEGQVILVHINDANWTIDHDNAGGGAGPILTKSAADITAIGVYQFIAISNVWYEV